MPVEGSGGEVAHPGVLIFQRSHQVWNSVRGLYVRHCRSSNSTHSGDLFTQSFRKNIWSPRVLEKRKMLECGAPDILILVAAKTEQGFHALRISKIARKANSSFTQSRIRIAQKWKDTLHH